MEINVCWRINFGSIKLIKTNEIPLIIAKIASKITNILKDPKVDINGKKFSPQEISAMILQKLKTDAENYLGQNGKV